ncbi:MAG: hypothetical protein KBS74_02505 [Clostridiales bacterium]|nr:hypothetical protein [Candidatus Cacconaster stercorequi]
MAKKKRRKDEPAPVETGFDGRPWERSAENSVSDDGAQAPDGVSGDWS